MSEKVNRKEYMKKYMAKKRAERKKEKPPYMSFKEWLDKEEIEDRRRDPFDCDWMCYLVDKKHYETH